MFDIKPIKEKINSVELLRIIFTFAIIFLHIFLILDKKKEIYEYCRHSLFAVDFFYIIAGFFLCSSFGKNFKDWFCSRIVRLFSVFLVVTIVIALYVHPAFYRLIMDFLLITALGINEKGPLATYCWYLFPLFWVSCFYYCLANIVTKKFNYCFVVSLLVYFAAMILYNEQSFHLGHLKNINNFFNIGVLRAVIGLGIGVLIRTVSYNANLIRNLKSRIFFTLLELFLFVYLLAQFFFVPDKSVMNYAICYIAIFSVLLVLFVNNSGYFSRWLNSLNFDKVSCYCFSWYVAQCFSKYFIPQTLANNKYIFCSILLTVVSGILLYHLVEVPANKLYNKYRSKINENS